MKKTLIFVGIGISLFLFAVGQRLSDPSESFGETALVELGSRTFTLDVADTDDEHTRGLSGRESLAPGTGMLFVFPVLGKYGFWMKDMRFSIDIAWLNDDWCLVHLVSRASPDSYPLVYAPQAEARYVIEVPSGVFEAEKLSEGDCISPPER